MSLDYFLPFSLRIRNLGITSQIQNQKPNTKSEPEIGSYTPKQGSGEQPGSVACKDPLVMRGLWCCGPGILVPAVGQILCLFSVSVSSSVNSGI